MALIANVARNALLSLSETGAGVAAAGRLARRYLGAKGAKREKLLAMLGTAAGQRDLFAALRAFAPNLAVKKSLVTAYPNSGTVIVTRAADVREVLDREADFAVVYEPKMRKITAGPNFFLGMQDGDDYQRDTSLMRLAAKRTDVAEIVAPLFRAEAERITAAHPGAIDVPAVLTRVVPTLMVQRYFGVDTAPVEDLADWATAMFWYLFVDLVGDAKIEARALDAAARCRDAIDAAVAARAAAPSDEVDVIRRCLALRDGGTAGFEGDQVRNNLIGLVIGAIPTISKASVHALDGLLDRPEALAEAQAAARANDEAALGRVLFEALRFNPVNPVIYRRATRDAVIAAGTLHRRKVPKDAMVLASNLSAMFDPAEVEAPGDFRSDRPGSTYILWGYGLHRCFGDAINRAAIPALLRPLLAGGPLRRAAGAAGKVDTAGTPFPQHFTVER